MKENQNTHRPLKNSINEQQCIIASTSPHKTPVVTAFFGSKSHNRKYVPGFY